MLSPERKDRLLLAQVLLRHLTRQQQANYRRLLDNVTAVANSECHGTAPMLKANKRLSYPPLPTGPLARICSRQHVG